MPYADKEVAKAYWREWKRQYRVLNEERIKARDAKYYRENIPRIAPRMRARSLAARYGIDESAYQKFLSQQNGMCAICQKPQASGRRLAVDHCHETGVIRGLLCQACNSRVEKFTRYVQRTHNITLKNEVITTIHREIEAASAA